MTRLRLYSETVAPTGNIASEGVLNQLGRSGFDPLQLLVRETVQNSWDARCSESTPVRFSVAGWIATTAQLSKLRSEVFGEIPDGLPLKSVLGSTEPVILLTIADRGATGLTGPVRADEEPQPGERANFANFFFNVGLPPDRQFSGGTYGYGKSALYRAGQARTICVHTRCARPSGVESRFLAAALGDDSTRRPRDGRAVPLTGRHWWGTVQKDGVAPVVGKDADDLATNLGMPDYDGRTGTTILVIQPWIGERSPADAMRAIASAILWHCWPKMVASFTQASMQFSVSWNGQSISLPDPAVASPLNGFVAALVALRTRGNEEVRGLRDTVIPIELQRPRTFLGTLALHRYQMEGRHPLLDGDLGGPIDGLAHHVALLRQPGLVVRYLPGPPLPLSVVQYAGVFQTAAAVDPTFARSETPTHDEWKWESLTDRQQRSVVRVGLSRIDAVLDDFTRVPGAKPAETAALPVARIASGLGWLLPGLGGEDAVVPRTTTSGSARPAVGLGRAGDVNGTRTNTATGRAPARAEVGRPVVHTGSGQLTVLDGAPVYVIPFTVEHVSPAGSRISARTAVVLENGQYEEDPPEGAQLPAVAAWISPSGTRSSESTMIVPAASVGEWSVVVSAPPDTRVSLTLDATDAGAS